MTRIPSTTTAIALGLAALLSAATVGCSAARKSPLELSETAMSPPATPSVPDAGMVLASTVPEPVTVRSPLADCDPEVRPDSAADRTPETATGSASVFVSDKTALPWTVRHVKESTFDAEVLQSDVPVLVDFYADWCGPCKKLSPLLDQLAYQTEGARIVKVNIDDSPQLAIRYGVKGIPHLKVFKDGKAVAQHVGMANRQQLAELLSL